MDRRNFLQLGSAGAAGLLMAGSAMAGNFPAGAKQPPSAAPGNPITGNTTIKPISGSWFEFQHLLPFEGKYWDPALNKFTAAQWKQAVKAIKGIGFAYLVLQEMPLDVKPVY